MNWLRRKIRSFLFPEDESEVHQIKSARLSSHGSLNHRLDDDNGLRFHVYNAQGGKIVQVYQHDRKRDETTTSLYVIDNDENFGDNIGKIIFMEMLKKG